MAVKKTATKQTPPASTKTKGKAKKGTGGEGPKTAGKRGNAGKTY